MYFYLILIFLPVFFYFINYKKNINGRYINKYNLNNNYYINKNGFNKIDHFYILTLKKNITRRINLINIFKKLYIKVYQDNLFFAFDGKLIINKKNELIDENLIHKEFKYYFPIKPLYFNIWRSKGCLGHYISFYQIFQNAIFNNLEYFMIIEDDSVFNNNIKVFDYVNIMKENNCDFLSLGQSKNFYQSNYTLLSSNKFIYNKYGYKFFKISDSNGLFQQTHTVIFRTEAIKKIIYNYFPMKCPTDVMLGNLCRNYETTIENNILFQKSKCNQKLNGLFVYPSLSEQNDSYNSDIENYFFSL